MLVDLEVFYLGHLKNFYTIQYNTIQPSYLHFCLISLILRLCSLQCHRHAAINAIIVIMFYLKSLIFDTSYPFLSVDSSFQGHVGITHFLEI